MIELLLALVTQDRDMKMTEVATGLHEEVPGGLLLVIAYAVIVAVVVGFVARIALKQRATEAALDALEKAPASDRPDKGKG
ncbi:MAG: hypothetical protein HYY84_13195 [Deltaproteobacteria bacterium]|nr:hypothetical protein [Deltaproteobacteria bacterium]